MRLIFAISIEESSWEKKVVVCAGCRPGADRAKDRIELETVGWSRGLESWSLDYRILRGNLNQVSVWQELAAYLQTKFPHPWGFECPIDGVGIDTGGHYTQKVYQFVASRPLPNTFGIKGKGAVGQKWIERSDSVRGLHIVAVDVIKRAIYDQLALTVELPAGRHNEALDARVYSRVVVEILRPA